MSYTHSRACVSPGRVRRGQLFVWSHQPGWGYASVRLGRYRSCVSKYTWTPRCAICREPSVEEVPVPKPAIDDVPRLGVPLCIEHRRLLVAGILHLGWCPVGCDYSYHLDYCFKHKQLMVAP